MAQRQENDEEEIWKSGQICKVYDHSRKRWVEGKVIEVFEDNGEEYVRVEYGKRIRDIPPNDPDLRPTESKQKIADPNRERAVISREAKVASTVDELLTKFEPLMKEIIAKSHDLKKEEMREELTWYNVMQCVRHELYPAMAISLSQAVEELVFKSGFAVGDLSEKAVERVIGVLKTKKVLFSNEIEYIQDLVGRARAFQWDQNEGTLYL